MFKCKVSSMCIYLDDVCDGHTDCPYEDDEELCNLVNIECTSQCYCLFYALFCKDVSALHFHTTNLPYISVSINFCNLSSPKIFQLFPLAAFLNFCHNSIEEFCHLLLRSIYLISLDISHNMIESIQSHCFEEQVNLRYIILNNNQIYSVHGNFFFGLVTVFLFNLANNKLKEFSNNAFAKNINFHVLNIYNNSFYLSKLETCEKFGGINMFRTLFTWNIFSGFWTFSASKILLLLKNGKTTPCV